MVVSYVTTPGGEELALLPRAEFEALKEAATHARAIADYRAGRLPGLSPDETRALVEAVSPLAFWRKREGLTQGALAEQVGVAQNYLSDVENGKRAGTVSLWIKLAAVLSLPVEALVDED